MNSKKNVLTLNLKGNEIKIDMDLLDFDEDNKSITIGSNEGLYSAIIDQDGKIIIPFVKMDDISCHFIPFDKNKVIYGKMENGKQKFYSFELNKDNYEIKNDEFILKKALMEFDEYEKINYALASIYKDNDYYLYDVSENKKISINFDEIILCENHIVGKILATLKIDNPTICIYCFLSYEGVMSNWLNVDSRQIWYSDKDLKSKESVINAVNSTYKDLDDNKKEGSLLLQS